MIIGMINSTEGHLLVYIIQSLALGAMIYVVFMQMLSSTAGWFAKINDNLQKLIKFSLFCR